MKLKFFVIGTCFSGFLFKEKLLGNYANGNIQMVYQHQHDLFASIMSAPIDVDVSTATSAFQWDFNHFAKSIFKKDIVQRIKDAQPDYIVVDLWPEAGCPMVQINDSTYIPSNYYIKDSSVYDKLPKMRIIEREDKERFELFKKYFKQFIDTIKIESPNSKFILVKTRSTTELYDSDELGRSIFDYHKTIQAIDERKAMYENYVLENFEGIRCLDMMDEYELASTRIKEDYDYEISHNHYTVEYYRRQYHKLQNIIIQDMLGGREKTRYFNQAVCIRAYDDYQMVLLMAKIYKDFFRVYILIDSDSIGREFTEEQISRLRRVPNVSVMTRYKAPRGSYNELLGLLELSERAFSNKDVKYVHYLTNMDMLIRPVNQLYQYYDTLDDGSVFLNCHAGGDRTEMEKVAEYTYRYYHYLFNEDENDANVKEMANASVAHQKRMGICRKGIGEFTEVYKGVLGGSLTREAYEYCVKYIEKHPEYMEDIKYTRLRIEFFWHTLLYNAKEFEGKIKKHIRGSKFDWIWDDKKRDYATIDADKYNRLKINENTFFVRKVNSKNTEVLNLILKDVKSPYKLEL